MRLVGWTGSCWWGGALALALGVVAVGPSLGGPIGAVGDVYVSDGDQTGIFQYDGVTGDFVPGSSGGYFAGRSPRVSWGQAWGPDGSLYVANMGIPGRWFVDKFDGNTGAWMATVLSWTANPDGYIKKGLVFGPDGDLYVGDWFNARVDRYAAGTFAWKAGYTNGAGGPLGTPNGMTFAPNGELLVISGGYNTVLRFDTSGDGVNLLGAFASLPNAQQPQDLSFGPNGNLFVSGGYTGNVMEFDGTTGAYVGDFVPPDSGRSALGLRFDAHGRLLLAAAGTGGYKVLAYDASNGNLLGDFIPEGSGGISSPVYLSIKVPEPATLGLLLVGGSVLCRRRGVGG